jgi:hypothetical protein
LAHQIKKGCSHLQGIKEDGKECSQVICKEEDEEMVEEEEEKKMSQTGRRNECWLVGTWFDELELRTAFMIGF